MWLLRQIVRELSPSSPTFVALIHVTTDLRIRSMASGSRPLQIRSNLQPGWRNGDEEHSSVGTLARIRALMYYNFGRVHQTLRVTSAMEAGISDHVWEVQEIVSLLN